MLLTYLYRPATGAAQNLQGYVWLSLGDNFFFLLQKPRRSARLATNASVIYSDEDIMEEEEMPPAKAKKPRKPRAKKTPKKPKVQPENVPVSESTQSTQSYSLRVTQSSADSSPKVTSYSLRSSNRANYSSDDDTDFTSVRHGKKVSTPTTRKPIGRMALSEARFRADIDKQTGSSSTPFTEDTTTTRSKRKNLDSTMETTTTRITRKTSVPDPKDAAAGASTVEEEEEVVTIVTSEKPPATAERAAWLEIGWKEVCLAGFLAGIGVLGYTCYVSDVCGYC